MIDDDEMSFWFLLNFLLFKSEDIVTLFQGLKFQKQPSAPVKSFPREELS